MFRKFLDDVCLTSNCLWMKLKESSLTWLAGMSAASTFDDEEEVLGRAMENEAAYKGKSFLK